MRKYFAAALMLLLLVVLPAAQADLSLPEDLTEIAEQAFMNDSSLAGRLVIPDSVKSIGANAFGGCTDLTEVVMPATVTSIDSTAFDGCKDTIRFEVMAESYAHIWCETYGYKYRILSQGTEEMNYEWTLKEDRTVRIDRYIGDANAVDVTIPDVIGGYTVTEIGNSAFANSSLYFSSLYGKITQSLPEDQQHHLSGKLTIPDTVVTIGDCAFAGCAGFTGKLILPANLETVGDAAFAGCLGFTDGLTIPDGVTTIGDLAFEAWRENTGTLTLPKSLTVIGDDAFSNCAFTGQLIIPDGVMEINDDAFYKCSSFTGRLILPDSLTVIGKHAFAFCSGFTGELILPDGLKQLKDGAFYACTGLTGELHIPQGLAEVGTFIQRSSGSSYAGASYGVFEECRGITNVIFNDNIQTIGNNAFSGTGLTSVVLPKNLMKIGESAFGFCSMLNELVLPDNLTNIGSYLVYSSYTDLYINAGTQTSKNIIGTSNTIIFTDKDYPGFQFKQETKDGSVILTKYTGSAQTEAVPSYVCSIDSYAFDGCSDIIEITLPENISTIGACAFSNCTNLTTINLPEQLTELKSGVFSACTNLKNIEIPKNVTRIGQSAFYKCTSLKSLIIPEGVTEIGNQAFYGCTGLRGDLILPNTIRSIGSMAFRNCGFDGILVLPDSIESLTMYMFENAKFTTVYGGKNLTYIDSQAFYYYEYSYVSIKRLFLHNKLDNLDDVFKINSSWHKGYDPKAYYWNDEYQSFVGVLNPETGEKTTVYIEPAFSIDVEPESRINETTIELPITVRIQKGTEFFDPYTEIPVYETMEMVHLYVSVPECCAEGSELFLPSEDAEHVIIPDEEAEYGFTMGIDLRKLVQVESASDSIKLQLCCNALSSEGHAKDHEIILELYTSYGSLAEPTLHTARFNDLDDIKAVGENLLLSFMDSVLLKPDELLGVMKADSSDTWYNYLVNTAVDVVNLNFDDLNILYNKEEFLFANALKFSEGDSTAELVKLDLLSEGAEALNDKLITDKNIFFDSLVLLSNDQLGSQVDCQSFKDLFEQYRKGDISKENYESGLTFCGIDASKIEGVVSISEWLGELSLINDVAEDIGKVESRVNGIVDLWNQWQMVNALDKDSLLAAARIYKQSDDVTIAAVGYKLEAMANLNDVGRITMLTAGDWLHANINKMVDNALEKVVASSFNNGFMATVSITNVVINKFTNVDQIPRLTNEVRYAADAARSTYAVFEKEYAEYLSSPTSERFEKAYWDYIVYLESAAQSQDSFIALYQSVDESLVGQTFITDEARQMLAWAEEQSEGLRRFADEARAAYQLREDGDGYAFRDKIYEIRKNIYTNSFNGGGGNGGGGGGGGGW